MKKHILYSKILKNNDFTYYIGIDPGTNILGFAIIYQSNLIKSGILNLSNEKKQGIKLLFIYNFFEKLIIELINQNNQIKNNIIFGIEKQFVNKNVHSAFILIAVKTIFILLTEKFNLQIKEFSPREIKKIIYGNGNATKEQIMSAVKLHFENFECKNFDESDAIAIAICLICKNNIIC